MLKAFIVFLALVATCLANPSGNPDCNLVPGHGTSLDSGGTFSVASSASSYTAGGSALTLTLSSTSTAFKGFFITVIDANGVQQGSFSSLPTGAKNGQLSACATTAATHVNNLAKTNLVFTWTPPSTSKGTLTVSATLVTAYTANYFVVKSIVTAAESTSSPTPLPTLQPTPAPTPSPPAAMVSSATLVRTSVLTSAEQALWIQSYLSASSSISTAVITKQTLTSVPSSMLSVGLQATSLEVQTTLTPLSTVTAAAWSTVLTSTLTSSNTALTTSLKTASSGADVTLKTPSPTSAPVVSSSAGPSSFIAMQALVAIAVVAAAFL